MDNIFALCHQSDIDGVGSASMIKMRYGIKSNNLFFTDYSLENVVRSKDEICRAAKRGAMLIIADLGLNESTKKPLAALIRHIRGNGGRVYWFDHHVWDEDGIRNIASKCDAAIVNENAKYCATEIVRNELHLESSFCREFAKIVHYSDFNIESSDKRYTKRIIEYAMSITSYQQVKDYSLRNRKLRHVAEVISSGRFSDARIRNDARKFDRINKERIEKMLNKLIVLEKVAVGFHKGVQTTIACGAIMKKSGKDISVYVNLDNMHGHIRTEKADCRPVAGYFGGGGHPHAAGFVIKKRYDFSKESERKGFAELIERKAQELC